MVIKVDINIRFVKLVLTSVIGALVNITINNISYEQERTRSRS